MGECTHDCSSCSEKCSERQISKEKQNEFSNVKKVIGIVSGKGGVGKSLVTSLLSVLTNRLGYKTAILDADITGPSIPKMFGVKEKAQAMDDKYIILFLSGKTLRFMHRKLIFCDIIKMTRRKMPNWYIQYGSEVREGEENAERKQP